MALDDRGAAGWRVFPVDLCRRSPKAGITTPAEVRKMAEAAAEANAEMRRYWNQVAGPRWVGLGGLVERRNGEVNPLLLRYLRPAPGEQVLEIGCGTGATTVPVAAAVGEAGAVVAADISEPMLAAARRALAEAGLGNVTLLFADAQTHPFPPSRFDLVFSRFGVMFFADPYAAFRNLIGALKPGGRLVFACWAPLAENEHMLLPFEVARHRLGPPTPRPAREPGPFAFADPDYVRDILAGAGFETIAVDREHPDMIGGTPEEEARYALTMGPSMRLIEEKEADAAARDAIAREIAETFGARAAAGPIRLKSTVFIVTARRPGGQQ
jgi:SAM-dependent methyltransferase